MIKQIENILKSEFPSELVSRISEYYYKAICQYKKKSWQYFGNEIGRFIEIALRMIEYKTEGKYTKIEERLPIFNESRLKDFEQSKLTKVSALRIIIPRQLYSMYCIRNKRGMIHVSEIDPNYMDSMVLVNMAKWILSEFVRLSSKLDYRQSVELINTIMSRENELIWIEDDIFKVLDKSISLEYKILCILYYKNKINDIELFKISEYTNITRFRRKLKEMDKDKKIDYKKEKVCISPIGQSIAEKILNKEGKIS